MRRALLLATIAAFGPAALPGAAGAAATGGAEAGTSPGGAFHDPRAPEPLRVRSFAATPSSVAVRVDGPRGRVRVRVDVLTADRRTVVKRVGLGSRRTGRRMRLRWTPALAPGEYVPRVLATAADGRRARRTVREPLTIVPAAPPAPPPAATPPPPPAQAGGSFPVQGPFTWGDGFGASRPGHAHQGQDLLAAEGTPVVSPAAGVVHWRAYQGAGAGHYLVIRSPGLGDHAYMHLREGSIAVVKGAAVAAGQRIAEVGSTGRSSAPHLHFELWPDGWWEGDARPIDPRPRLEGWASGRG